MGFSSQTAQRASAILVSTGSILPDTDDEVEASAEVKKLVKHATMQTEVSARTFCKDSEKISRLPHGMIWAAFERGHARKDVLLTFLWTLESPMRLKHLDCDMMNTKFTKTAPSVYQSLL